MEDLSITRERYNCMQPSYTSTGVFEWPEDRLPLDYDKILPNKTMADDILSLTVKCSFYKEGCKWHDKLRALQTHLESCEYNLIPCTYNCGATVARMLMNEHFRYDCPKQRSKCEFCGGEFPGDRLEAHSGNCQYELVFCEHKCGGELQRRFLNKHMLNECPKRTVPCKYCLKDFVCDTLQNHLHQCPRYLIACPNRCDQKKIAREDMEKHVRETCSTSMAATCPFREHGCKFRGSRYSLESHIKENTSQHLVLVCEVVRRQKRQIDSLTNKLHALNTSMNGTLLWRITDYASKFASAKSAHGIELRSLPFYTSQYGYKLQATVFLNGNGSGEGNSLSLYIKVLCSEYDSLLPWPFTLPITFTLMDQSDPPNKRMHIKEAFTPDPSWKNFQRPSKDIESLGYGYPTFVSHSFLQSRKYVKNDTLFIKVTVDNSSVMEI
ncbi:TNF receptor-associated factor 4-like isoform X2 [Anneissia japonica]|uniref:TNF receptor-associated factor 4-like isoform X2 n=1 Tax=Anneissia japonica TaxID=1529436 RepID=UPI001425A913|nr:TNF receptor-associated factor 4-like isoform X2 [Anneissia japonica]